MGTVIPRGDKWQAKVRMRGQKASKTFKTKSAAEQWVTQTEAKIYTGEPVDNASIQKLMIGKILEEFEENNEIKGNKVFRIRKLKAEFAKVPLGNFRTAGLERYIKAKLEQEIKPQAKTRKVHKDFKNYKKVVDGKEVARTYSPSTVRKYYYDLRTALEWHAKFHDYPFNDKPFNDVAPPAAWTEPRERRLHEGELERLLAATDDMYVNQEALKCIILFQVYSAMRIGETLLMQWKDVHLDRQNPSASYVFVPKKNQKIKDKAGAENRYVLMRPELYKLFERIDALTKDSAGKDKVFHFWKSSATFGARFKVVVRNAGSEELTTHDLRHEAISWFFENTSLTDIEISNISGHLELDTLRRYANLRPKKTGAKLWVNEPVATA